MEKDLIDYLNSVKKQFAYYKQLGEQTINQLPETALFAQPHSVSNSIGVIVNHLSGNMLSRWTDLLTTDGEKDWRNRESEFENDIQSRAHLLEVWEKGWACLFNALDTLSVKDLGREIFIRNEGHTVIEAINRQLAHYPYHIGQIVFIGKMVMGDKWESLSIPRGQSQQYNSEKFAKPRQTGHFENDD